MCESHAQLLRADLSPQTGESKISRLHIRHVQYGPGGSPEDVEKDFHIEAGPWLSDGHRASTVALSRQLEAARTSTNPALHQHNQGVWNTKHVLVLGGSGLCAQEMKKKYAP